jgi:hypothetical protein
MDIVVIAVRRIGIYLVVALASMLGLSLQNEAAAKSTTCSTAELERMVEASLSFLCPGTFTSPTDAAQLEQANRLEAIELTEAEGTDAITPEPELPESPDGVILYCGFKANGDYAHISATQIDVSAHGWWAITINFRCPAQSTVTTSLKGYWCDAAGCRWIEVGYDTQYIGPKAITGQRTTARRACTPGRLVGYKSTVKVTLGGTSRTDSYTTQYQNLNCYPI